ncbi:MAG: tRNA (adenosine(37)-N6)-threonylcarbamoyltransferase complex ATPase subunit type 1 TsaE, partial [Tidjanibacter sp.]|nr:tRNA (adenosine(37)-N6)-threonylcarbamoyltransferase complex ATPase subunit type 1 TsaE [Tidjanibacter sp.]
MKRKEYDLGDLKEVAEMILESLDGRNVVVFRGEMGAGKTTLISALCEVLGVEDDVTSPTFALVNEYRTGRKVLYHFDMYRITGFDDLYSTGFFDYLDGDGILAI